LEAKGLLVVWMARTFQYLREREKYFEEPPYNLGWQAWSEAMIEYLNAGPHKELGRAISYSRKRKMWVTVMGIDSTE